MKPSLGRIVLFRGPETEDNEYPAIITKVWSDVCVNLTVFWAGIPFNISSVCYDELKSQLFGWSWPPRVS